MITVKGVVSRNLDHIVPNGILLDNNSSIPLLEDLLKLNPKFSLLDLGCAGGGFVIDAVGMGVDAVGIDNSDYALKNTIAVGHENWKTYYGKNLFCADISYPFEILEDDVPKLFDVITCWECLEHIKRPRLHDTLKRISGLLKPNGFFLATINTRAGFYHASVYDREVWLTSILPKYFKVEQYPFTSCPRMDACPTLDFYSSESIAVLCRAL